MAKLSVLSMAGEVVGDLDLSSKVFEAEYNQGLVHQIFTGLLANRRHGTADTKGRGEVRGGGKKPWRQKGTGNARHGSRRSPIWKGGGISFGPTPRSYNQALPKKMRHAAMRCALSQRVRESNFVALNEVKFDTYKTKAVVEMLVKVASHAHESTKDRTLLVIDKHDTVILKSAANIPGLTVVTVDQLNLVDIVLTHRVLATKGAIQHLEEQLS
jgi:large subunit ribosomal protein L4